MHLKAKECKHCGEQFHPARPMQAVCGITCAIERSRKKRIAEARKRRDKAHKVRKKAIRTHPEWVKIAQRAFNEYVRIRDEGKACISCGKLKPLTAGHWLSVGSSPSTRFDLRNCVGQCMGCNQGQTRYRADGVVGAKFDLGMAERYGKARLDWKHSPHPPKKYSKEDLERMARIFRRRARIYRKLRDAG